MMRGLKREVNCLVVPHNGLNLEGNALGYSRKGIYRKVLELEMSRINWAWMTMWREEIYSDEFDDRMDDLL